MSAKLELLKQLTSPRAIQEAWLFRAEGRTKYKLMVLANLYCEEDPRLSRKEFVEGYGISIRTLQRWIHEFNILGVAGILQSAPRLPGRKRKVDQFDFRNRILPAAEGAVQAEGDQATMRDLFRSAQSLGIFPGSYSTFRRCLGMVNKNYQRPRQALSIEEWLLGNLTGKWPAWLKAFRRRRAKQERVAWQKLKMDKSMETNV